MNKEAIQKVLPTNPQQRLDQAKRLYDQSDNQFNKNNSLDSQKFLNTAISLLQKDYFVQTNLLSQSQSLLMNCLRLLIKIHLSNNDYQSGYQNVLIIINSIQSRRKQKLIKPDISSNLQDDEDLYEMLKIQFQCEEKLRNQAEQADQTYELIANLAEQIGQLNDSIFDNDEHDNQEEVESNSEKFQNQNSSQSILSPRERSDSKPSDTINHEEIMEYQKLQDKIKKEAQNKGKMNNSLNILYSLIIGGLSSYVIGQLFFKKYSRKFGILPGLLLAILTYYFTTSQIRQKQNK